jgi:hypothetical protein
VGNIVSLPKHPYGPFLTPVQGNFIGGIVAIIVLAAFKPAIHERHEYGQFNAVWRIITGIILVPCLITLVQRLMLPGEEDLSFSSQGPHNSYPSNKHTRVDKDEERPSPPRGPLASQQDA